MIRPLIGKVINGVIKPLGYELVCRKPSPPPPVPVTAPPLVTLIKHYAIDTVIDVGANEGQFGLELRHHGFNGLIISLEPLSQAFNQLQSIALANGPWETYPNAAGDKDGITQINVAGNLLSSSILPMLRRHEEAAPPSRYTGKEAVSMRTLDSLFAQRLGLLGRIFLKLDVQGFEPQVLSGGPQLLDHAVGVLLETSLVPLYEGSICLAEMLPMMTAKGFLLHHVERVFWDEKTQQLLQLDCAFFKEHPALTGKTGTL
jgi:FkbM family methyltransferase